MVKKEHVEVEGERGRGWLVLGRKEHEIWGKGKKERVVSVGEDGSMRLRKKESKGEGG